MAALSQSLFASGTVAFLLHPLFHGHPGRTGTGDSFWVQYFTMGGLQIDYRLMLGAFILVFLVAPTVLGIWLSLHSSQPRFTSIGSFLGFGALLLLGLAFNAIVALGYLVTNLEQQRTILTLQRLWITCSSSRLICCVRRKP